MNQRNHRFLEEALELAQAKGCTKQEALQLAYYVFGRPCGEPSQEVGGVMNTLAALCISSGMDLMESAHRELERVSAPEVMAKIRAKRASAPNGSPLPGTANDCTSEPSSALAPLSQGWVAFDPMHPPQDGVYWALVCDPCYDIDVDDQGKTVGFPTGEIATRVVMVRFDGITEDGPDFSAVDHYLFGNVSEESRITALKSVAMPEVPSELAFQTPRAQS